MKYRVTITKRAQKSAAKMPMKERGRLRDLVTQMEESGPVRPEWPNYSPLGPGKHHCHLSYHWVACWRHEKETIEIEVYYAGSRENAPY